MLPTTTGLSVLGLGSLLVGYGFHRNNSYLIGLGLGVLALLLSGPLFYKKIVPSLQQVEKETLLEIGEVQKVEFLCSTNTPSSRVTVKKINKWCSKQEYYITSKTSSIYLSLKPIVGGGIGRIAALVEYSDPLNLVKYSKKISIDANIYAKIPRVGATHVRVPWINVEIACEPESDDYDLRPWREGESLDFVNWKMSAKTGKRIVKTPYNNIKSSIITCYVKEKNEKNLNILRNEVEKILGKSHHVIVKLNHAECVVRLDNFQEFEIFLSKNLTTQRKTTVA